MDGADVEHAAYAMLYAFRDYILRACDIDIIQLAAIIPSDADDPCRVYDGCLIAIRTGKDRLQRIRDSHITVEIADPSGELFLLSRQYEAADDAVFTAEFPDDRASEVSSRTCYYI